MRNNQVTLYLVVILVVAWFTIFWRLDVNRLKIWDESRLAVNAAEMAARGNLLVTTYLGEPDLWNTKPPLMIWLQAGMIRVFGINELSVRLPAALSALATVLVIFFFCVRYLKKPFAGFLSALILMTSPGFIVAHVARHGEYDALLVLWITLSILSCYLFTLVTDP